MTDQTELTTNETTTAPEQSAPQSAPTPRKSRTTNRTSPGASVREARSRLAASEPAPQGKNPSAEYDKASRIKGLLKDTNLTQQQAAIIHDPNLRPRVRQGVVQVEVLKNMVYLEGRFYSAGARVNVSMLEGEAAVKQGCARYLQTLPAGEE